MKPNTDCLKINNTYKHLVILIRKKMKEIQTTKIWNKMGKPTFILQMLKR